MKYVTWDKIEAICLDNFELPGGKDHPDYIDTSTLSCKCPNCGETLEVLADGNDGCTYCEFRLTNR